MSGEDRARPAPSESVPAAANPPPRRPVRRYRRLAWTISVSVGALAACVWIGVALYRTSTPAEYSPGEDNPDLTRTYAQPYEKGGAGGAGRRRDWSHEEGFRPQDRELPPGAPPPLFADVTAGAGLSGFATFAGPRTSQLPEDMSSGLAWGDFDNDGDEDLFLVSGGGALTLPAGQRARSELYRNAGGGSFRRVEDFPDLRILGMGAAWADFNNDGWLDLLVSGYDTMLLFRNERGKLVRDARLPSPKGFWSGVAWGDYDRDGWQDLYVCAYVNYRPKPGFAGPSLQFGREVPYTLNPSSFEPAANLLFHNERGRFVEVAGKLGVGNPEGRSLSALWHDFDQDGWLDLYVANDVSENKLFLNRNGKFTDSGKQSWVAEYRGSMGLAAGDWDNDGDDDLFISHWVAQQYALYNSLLEEQRSAAKAGVSRELHFMDVAEMSGIGQVSLQSIGWGSEFFDFDSDGWLDLAVANGSTFETQDQPRKLAPMESFLFWNGGGKFMYNLAPWNMSFSTPKVSRGLAVADYDGDGAVDVAMTDLGEGVRLLRNRIPQGRWIQLRLRQRLPGGGLGFGDGATVVAHAGGRRMRRSVTSASYLSQSSRQVHIGLGQAQRVEKLEVRWPDGSVQPFADLDAGVKWELIQGDPQPKRWGGPASVQLSKDQLIEFWARQRAAMSALKQEGDIPKATVLFRQALALKPSHEDSRYYLANCLAIQGDTTAAVEQLDELILINSHSHRAYQRRGLLLAASAKSAGDLQAAERSVEKALSINPEETGSLLLLGELALLRGDERTAAQRLEWACRTNPRATGGFFLRAYLAWKKGDNAQAEELLRASHGARGKEWKPKGSALEGDVLLQMHTDATLLSRFWDAWDGKAGAAQAFTALDRHLRSPRRY